MAGAMSDDAFPNPHACYIIFTSKSGDKHSKRQLRQEVNTMVPAVPQYMHWSDRPIS